jgi:nitroimidazol reductase NimA-like FMN-containing flavoprotein (pyridoxamine 5'-phosphate oxidase superfamily)
MALRWNPEVNMSKEEIDYFLDGRLIARLSTIGNDGFPNVAPVWYYWDGESIFFDLGMNRANTRNLRRDPRCAAVIDVDNRPVTGMRDNFARAVLIRGMAELYDHKAGQDEVFTIGKSTIRYSEISGKIDRRYIINPEVDGRLYDKLVSSASPTFHPYLQGEGDRVLVRVKPKKIRAWDFSKAPWRE